MPTEDERIDKAIGFIVATAKAASPNEPRKAVELMLLATLSYCRHDLKMTAKEACDAVDMCLATIFEQIAP